jgi:hypothetical protein
MKTPDEGGDEHAEEHRRAHDRARGRARSVASISGITPMMNAKAVIRIGRNRSRAASSAASTAVLPLSRSIFANSTIRMAFLAARPISITRPICT